MTLHVAVSGWLLGEPSGANRRLLRIVEHVGPMLQGGERITVLHRPGFAPPAPVDGVAWQPVPIAAGGPLRRALGERRALPGVLRRLGADILDHGLLPLPALEVPVCATIHDVRGLAGLSRWPRWLAARALRAAGRRAACVVVPSEFTAEAIAGLVDGAALAVVPNGIELPPEPAARPGGTAGWLLHVGHLERRKNVPLLLHALALLPAGERPPLLLVGRDAGAAGELRALANRLGVAAAVRFRGVVDDAELGPLHAGARAVVVPSLHEGFGFAALDGLAHGRPTLVADAGALPEVVGRAGVVLPTDQPRAWADAIRAAGATDDDRAVAARRARAAEFGWQRSARAMLDLWRQLVSARRS